MAYNKFIKQDGTVLCDLTADTVAPEYLAKGVTAHDRSGAVIEGTYEEPVLTYYDGTVTISGGVELISFTIDGTEYQAEDGMTWAEWCESDYAPNNANAGTYVTVGGKVVGISGSYVSSTDSIVASTAYTLTTMTSG